MSINVDQNSLTANNVQDKFEDMSRHFRKQKEQITNNKNVLLTKWSIHCMLLNVWMTFKAPTI